MLAVTSPHFNSRLTILTPLSLSKNYQFMNTHKKSKRLLKPKYDKDTRCQGIAWPIEKHDFRILKHDFRILAILSRYLTVFALL